MVTVLMLLIVIALLSRSLWGDPDHPDVVLDRPAWSAVQPPHLDEPQHIEVDTRNPPRDQVGQQPGTDDIPFFGVTMDPPLRRPSYAHLMPVGTNPLLPLNP